MPIYPYTKKNKEHYYYAFEVKLPNGKRKTIKKQGFTSKKDAKEAERLARVEWDQQAYIDTSKLTVYQYLQEWLKTKKNLSEDSRNVYTFIINKHLITGFGEVLLQKATVHDLKKFINKLSEGDLSESTVKKIYNVVQTAFNTATKEELINKNPFTLLDNGTKPVAKKSVADFWTKDEVKEFFVKYDKSEEPRMKLLYTIAIYTGMRRGEILGLTWKNIDLDNGVIRISQTLTPSGIKKGAKTSTSERSVTVSAHVMSELKKHRVAMIQERWEMMDKYKGTPEIVNELRKYYDEEDLVICQPNGKPINVSRFTQNWSSLIQRLGVRKIRFHDLRHTCASLLFSADTHPKVVQELLGHASVKITMDIYSHMLPNMQKQAVETLDRLLK
jgi:integrase